MTQFSDFFPDTPAQADPAEPRPLGMVVSGSLKEGLDLRLDAEVPLEDVKVGQYAIVQGEQSRFFCVVSDLELGVTDQALTTMPPDVNNPLVRAVLRGAGTFGLAHLVPTLALGPLGPKEPHPVRTVPPHYAPAFFATKEEIEGIFGDEDRDHLWIGSPLDMDSTHIRLNLPRLVERSSGVFGKTGTGKTFLTRILMAGILQKSAGVQLIFDMHNEYGWMGTTEEVHGSVKGLKQLFGSQVTVFTLDEQSSHARRVNIDGTVRIGYHELEPDDIADLQEALGLSEVAVQSIDAIRRVIGGRDWFGAFIDMDGEGLKDLAGQSNLHGGAIEALQRRLRYLTRLEFLTPGVEGDAIQQLMDYLERGKTVVLEFGKYKNNPLAQVLVANLLSRRIYQRWADRMEQALGEAAAEPPHLVITLEEAHKFLNPRMAGQTIFGTIAREMRKYKVTLLVVDQRPSAIDPEVLSQIGTKITCLLDDEKDLSAVLTGAAGSSQLRSVLSRLESKQQALIFGHAVPMPVVLRTREYGSPESYREFGFLEAAELERQAERDARDLFGR